MLPGRCSVSDPEPQQSWADRDRPGLGGGAFVLDPDDRVLLIRQGRSEGEIWTVPGGRHEPGESIEDCVLREVREETGLQVVLDRLVAVEQWLDEGALVGLGLQFLARPDRWPQTVTLPAAEDGATFLDYGWFTREEARALPALWFSEHVVDAWPTEIVVPIFRRHRAATPR